MDQASCCCCCCCSCCSGCQDQLLLPKVTELNACMEAMGKFVQELRDVTASMELIEEFDADSSDILSNMVDLQKKAEAHQEGWKIMSRRMKAML